MMSAPLNINQIEREAETGTITWDLNVEKLNPVIDFKNNTAYFAAHLPIIRYELDKKTKETITISEEMPCIINSNRQAEPIDWVSRKAMGFMLDVYPDYVDHNITLIKEYIETRKQPYTIVEAYDSIKATLVKYIDLDDKAEYDLLSCWIIGTYFHQLFTAFPMLHLNGTKRAGKTKVLTLLDCLCFNPILTLNQTPASLFRMTQSMHPTFLIDEAEQFGKKELTEHRSLLLARYKKGLKVYRIEEKNEGGAKIRYNKGYEVYGPTAIGNIEGLDDVVSDRSVSVTMRRTKNPTIANRTIVTTKQNWIDFKTEMKLFYLEEAHNISSLSSLFSKFLEEIGKLKEQKVMMSDVEKIIPSLLNRIELAGLVANNVVSDDSYDSYDNIYIILQKIHDFSPSLSLFLKSSSLHHFLHFFDKINGREMELWFPLIVVSIYRGESFASDLMQLAIRKTKEKEDGQNNFMIETQLVYVLHKMVTTESKLYFFVKDIASALTDVVHEQDNSLEKPFTSREISSVLKRVGLKERDHSRNSGVRVPITLEQVLDVAERLGIDLNRTD